MNNRQIDYLRSRGLCGLLVHGFPLRPILLPLHTWSSFSDLCLCMSQCRDDRLGISSRSWMHMRRDL